MRRLALLPLLALGACTRTVTTAGVSHEVPDNGGTILICIVACVMLINALEEQKSTIGRVAVGIILVLIALTGVGYAIGLLPLGPRL